MRRVATLVVCSLVVGGVAFASAGCASERAAASADEAPPRRFAALPALVAHIARDVLREMGAMELELEADDRQGRVRAEPVQGHEVTIEARHEGDGICVVEVQAGMFQAPKLRRDLLTRLAKRLPTRNRSFASS